MLLRILLVTIIGIAAAGIPTVLIADYRRQRNFRNERNRIVLEYDFATSQPGSSEKPAVEQLKTKQEHYADRTNYNRMRKEIRSWGIPIMILGVVHLFSFGFLESSWSFSLIFVGLMSLYFNSSAAMFVVYSVILIWATIGNLFLSGSMPWIAFSFMQAFVAVQTYRKFLLFRQIRTDYAAELDSGKVGQPLAEDQAVKIFPYLAVVLGGSGILVELTILFGVFYLGFADPTPGFLGWLSAIEALTLYMGTIGVAIGAAAVLSTFPNRVLSIMGIVSGSLRILIWLGILILAT